VKEGIILSQTIGLDVIYLFSYLTSKCCYVILSPGTVLKRYKLPTNTRGTKFGVKLLGKGAKYFIYNNKTHELSIGEMLHKYVVSSC
jgi:hypothetical protein